MSEEGGRTIFIEMERKGGKAECVWNKVWHRAFSGWASSSMFIINC